MAALPPTRAILEHRIVRFALVGGMATFTHITVAFMFIRLVANEVFLANLLGFGCAFGLSYFLQSLFVFRKNTSWKNASRFFLVQLTGLLIAQLISQLLVAYSPYYRILFVVFLIPLVTYFIHKIWTYNEK